MLTPAIYPDSINDIINGIEWSSKAGECVEKGDGFVRNNAFGDARTAYETALTIQPDNFDAMAGLDYIDYLEKPKNEMFQWGGNKKSLVDSDQREKNSILNRQEFEARKRRLTSWPRMCMLELTTRCNFSCYHCSRTYFRTKMTDMNHDILETLLNDVFPNLSWITVTGFGEQTISRSYHHLMSHLVDLGVTMHFSTNTSTLSEAHIEALVKHNANVILSVDGTSRAMFETIRHGGNWQSLIKTLFLIKRIRTILSGQSLFRITFVIMRMNIHELPDMVRLIHFFELDDLTVQDYLPCGDPEADKQTLQRDPVRGNHSLDTASELAGTLHVKVLVPDHFNTETIQDDGTILDRLLRTKRFFPKRRRFPMRCFQPWQNPGFRADGSVTPCCNSLRLMGSLYDGPFEDIWNGWRFRLFRYMVDTFLPPPECRRCNVIDGISAGNPGNTMSSEGLVIKALYYLERKLVSLFRHSDNT